MPESSKYTENVRDNSNVAKIIPLLLITSALIVGIPLRAALAQHNTINFNVPVQVVGTPVEDAEPPQIAAQGRKVYLVWHEFPDPNALDMQPDVCF